MGRKKKSPRSSNQASSKQGGASQSSKPESHSPAPKQPVSQPDSKPTAQPVLAAETQPVTAVQTQPARQVQPETQPSAQANPSKSCSSDSQPSAQRTEKEQKQAESQTASKQLEKQPASNKTPVKDKALPPSPQANMSQATPGKTPPAKPAQEQKASKSESAAQGAAASTAQDQADEGKTKAQLKAERKAKFEAERKAKLAAEGAQPEKSKAQLKAERRALQEQQRAAKAESEQATTTTAAAAAAGAGSGDKKSKDSTSTTPTATASKKPQAKEVHRVLDRICVDDEKTRKRLEKKLAKDNLPVRNSTQRKVRLFNHLHQFEREGSLDRLLWSMDFDAMSVEEYNARVKNGEKPISAIPKVIADLGLDYFLGDICGSNARCVALILALDKVVKGYVRPESKDFSRDFEAKLKKCISYLTVCRPISVSMGNFIKFFKLRLTQLPVTHTDKQAKAELSKYLAEFLKEKIFLAGRAIQNFVSEKIKDGDVVMTYGCSSLLTKVFKFTHESGKKFRVVIVDSRPKLEGRMMLKRLVSYGIPCSYVLINTASYVMKQVTKVFVGAHALLANGHVMSRVGTSQVALLAKRANVPVMVCCETYKFCEHVHTDSFVYNELGDPDELVNIERPEKETYLKDWRNLSHLTLLNLTYDVTPPDLVSAVISEMGMIPCTSVPVVLRVKHAETMYH